MGLQAGALVDVADFADTGQVDLSPFLNAGFTASSLNVSRTGQTVFLEGEVTPAANWGAANSNQLIISGGIAAQFLPLTNRLYVMPTAAGTAATIFRVQITTSGTLAVRCDTATHVSAVSLSLVYRGAPL